MLDGDETEIRHPSFFNRRAEISTRRRVVEGTMSFHEKCHSCQGLVEYGVSGEGAGPNYRKFHECVRGWRGQDPPFEPPSINYVRRDIFRTGGTGVRPQRNISPRVSV